MGDIIGGEDCFNGNKTRVDTVKCRSLCGELLEISYDEFSKQLKKAEGSWAIFKDQSLMKDKSRNRLLDYVNSVKEIPELGKSRSRENKLNVAKSAIFKSSTKIERKESKEASEERLSKKSKSPLLLSIAKATPMANYTNQVRSICSDPILRLLKKQADKVREYRPQANNKSCYLTPINVLRVSTRKQSNEAKSTIAKTPETKKIKITRQTMVKTTRK